MTPLGIALTVALAICGVVAYAAIAFFLWGVLAALFKKRGYNIRSKYVQGKTESLQMVAFFTSLFWPIAGVIWPILAGLHGLQHGLLKLKPVFISRGERVASWVYEEVVNPKENVPKGG